MLGLISTKEGVELPAGSRLGEAAEAALFGNEARAAHEAGPRATPQCAADADTTHSQRTDLAHRQRARKAEQQVERLGRHGAYHGLDLLGGSDPGRIQTIRAGLSVGLEPCHG